MSDSFFKRRLLSLLSLCVAFCLGGAMVHAGYAEAADEDIAVTLHKVVYSDGTKEIPDQHLEFSGLAVMYFNWTAEGKPGFQTGDSFSINLGDYFDNVEFGPDKKTDIRINHKTLGEVVVGECRPTTADLITCSFNEKVDELKVSFSQWRGTVKLTVRATQVTTEESVEIVVNQVGTLVVLRKTPAKDGNLPIVGIQKPIVRAASV